MAALWLPSDDRHALALREPNLLVPGKKPVGKCQVAPGVAILAAPEFSFSYGNNAPYVLGPSIEILNFPDPRFGKSFWGGPSAEDYDYVDLGNSGPLNAFTIISLVNITTFVTNLGIFGNFTGFASQILFRIKSAVPQLYIRNSSDVQFGPALSSSVSSGETVVLAARYDGAKLKTFTNGVGGSEVSASGNLTPSVPMRIGYMSLSQGAIAGHSAWTVLLNYPMSDAEIAEISINKDFGRFLKPANDAPYLISVPTGGATVTLSSPTATATGSTTATVGCQVTYT